jgi:hypothetical protein
MNDASTPARTKTPLVLKIAVAVAVLAALGAGLIALAVWKFWLYVRAGTELARQQAESQETPGAAALRARGCVMAGVMEYDRVPAEAQEAIGSPLRRGIRRWVWCTRPKGSSIDCDDLAATFVRTMPASQGAFAATVHENELGHAGAQVCSVDYAQDGSRRR